MYNKNLSKHTPDKKSSRLKNSRLLRYWVGESNSYCKIENLEY